MDETETLKDQVRQLRAALLALVYEKEGRWFVGINPDTDVTDEVLLAIRMSADPADGQLR